MTIRCYTRTHLKELSFPYACQIYIKITVNIIKVHDYLGMYLDYSYTVVIKVSMIKYLQKVLEESPKYLIGISSTSTVDHMFRVMGKEEAKFLEEDRSEIFHHSVAQFLFMSTTSRRYIKASVSFLSKIVKHPYLVEVKEVV